MKIYFSGSIYGGRQKLDTYKRLVKELKKYAEVLDEEVADDNVLNDEQWQSDNDIFEKLEGELNQADLIFAELTVPSLGVGYELGYADSHNKKIIGIYDKNIVDKVSTMIRGNKRIKIIPYTNIEDIINNLDNLLEEE
ncbi:MAG: nucleoside 2-deoxyribosyltransferase [Clostridia bacterium]|nr:nucleoside 2-deoxyribosyltransferase [Clostridia bacterium]